MAWTNSKIFIETIQDILENTTAMDLNSDTFKAALFGTLTPDQTVASANTAFNAGVWLTAAEITDATGWPSGGNALTSTCTVASNVVKFDADDRASVDAHSTLVAVFGVHVYSDTIAAPVADQGLCYLYLGGSQTATEGTFTVVFSASGIAAITL